MSRYINEIAEHYGMTPAEVYGDYDEPEYRLCEMCEAVVDESAPTIEWLYVTGPSRCCRECRRAHLRWLLKRWRTKPQRRPPVAALPAPKLSGTEGA